MSLRPRRPRTRIVPVVLGALLTLVLVVGLIAAFGGFREAKPAYPRVAKGEKVDLGRFLVSLESARVASKDPRGDDYPDHTKRLLVKAVVTNTDTDSGYLGEQLVVATVDGKKALKPDTSGAAGDPFQPGLATPVEFSFIVPAKSAATAEAKMFFQSESYGWNNLLSEGPAWSGAHPVASLVLTVRSES